MDQSLVAELAELRDAGSVEHSDCSWALEQADELVECWAEYSVDLMVAGSVGRLADHLAEYLVVLWEEN